MSRLQGTNAVERTLSTGLIEIHSSGTACGQNIECVNSFPIAFLLASGLLLFVLIFRLFGSRLLAMAASGIWFFSLPVFDAISWQATTYDKLCALFVLVDLNLALWFFHRHGTRVTISVANVLLLVPVVLAYNSKGSSFVLVPALVLLPLIGCSQGFWRWQRNLVLPIAYALAHNISAYALVQDDANYRRHVTSGQPWSNFKLFLAYLTGSYFGLRLVSVVMLLTAVVLVSVGVVRRLAPGRIGA